MSDRILHCWQDRASHVAEVYGFHSDEHIETYHEPGATCMLPRDHEGDHVFTLDDEIEIQIAEES